jgi:effector-binding domain-containing protein
MLRQKQHETLKRLREEETRLKKVEEWLKKVEKEGSMPVSEVLIKKVEAQLVASVRGVIPTYGDCSRLYKDLFGYLGKKRVNITEPSMSICHDQEYREKDVDVEVAIPISKTIEGSDKVKVYLLPGVEQMACIIHHGPYENFGQTYSALMKWVEGNKYQIAGPNREVYLKGPGLILKGNPANYITEIQLPVKK